MASRSKRAGAPTKPVGVSDRKNIVQPADWWTAFNAAARSEGKSLSEWMGDCCCQSLPRVVRTTLTARPGRGG